MRKLSKKTQLLGLSLLCVALIVFIVYLIIGGGDKTPVAVDSGAPAVSAPSTPTAPTTPANPTTPAPYAPTPVERVSGPLYYVESAAFFGLPEWYAQWWPAQIDKNNRLIVLSREEDAEIRPGIKGAREYLYITDCETAEEYGPLPAGYIIYRDDGEWLEAESFHNFTFDENNNMYVIYRDENNQKFLTVYDGQFNRIKDGIPWDAGYGLEYREIACYNGEIYAMYNGAGQSPGIAIFSTDGVRLDVMQEYPWVSNMCVTEDGFLYVNYDNARRDETYIGKFDLNTWEPVYGRKITDSIYDRLGIIRKIYFNPRDGYLYIAGSNAILRYDEANYTYEDMILYGADTSFFAGSYEAGDLYIQKFLCGRDGSLYMFGKTIDEGGAIYKFSMIPGEKLVREETAAATTLTLTALAGESFFTEAIKRYELLNPDIKIEYDVMYKSVDEFNENQNDAVARMLTRVLSNDIGDMVIIDGIVMQALETDVCIDLWDRVRSDESYPELNLYALNGLLSGGRKLDGQLRGLPIGLTYNYLLYNKALGDELGLAPDFDTFTWGGAIDLALELDLKGKGVYLYGGVQKDDMLFDIVRRNLPDLMDRESKFVDLKQDWFLALLEKLKTVEALGVTRIADIYGGAYSDCLFIGGGYFSRDYDNATYQAANYGEDYIVIPMLAGERNRNATANPDYMCAISANSRLQDEAWGFLSYLIDNKTQGMLSFEAIPVNNRTIGARDKTLSDTYKTAIEQLRVIFDRIDMLADSKYNGYLFRPLTDYIYGSGSLNAALDKAEYDIWLMLNE